MMRTAFTMRELLEHPHIREKMDHRDMDRILDALRKAGKETRDPIYIRIFASGGAWVAAIFLLWFLSLIRVLRNGVGALICGIILFVVAITLTRTKKSVFLNPLSLALAFTGNGLILFSIATLVPHDVLPALVIVQAIFCVLAYPLYRNKVYLFLSPISLVILITAWIIENRAFHLMHGLIASEALLLGILSLRKKRRDLFIPLLYSAAMLLPVTLMFINLTQVFPWRLHFSVPLWPSSLLLCGGMIYLYMHLAGGANRFKEPWLIFPSGFTILLGTFTTPGILVAMGLLVLGYAFGDRILTGLSYLFLPAFLVVFYYVLNLNLAYKSYVIAGSGILFLMGRWIAGFIQQQQEGVA